MEFKNTKPTAADFFRKFSDLIAEAEKDDEKDDKKSEIKKDDKKKEDKKDKKTLKESTAKSPGLYEKMMGIEPLTETEMGFAKLEKSVAKNPKVDNPGAVAAEIGRKKYGQKEMTRRSVAGKKDEGVEDECVMEDDIEEKWEPKAKMNPKKKGMFKGKTKGELEKQEKALVKSGPHPKGSAANTKEHELNFAIRAKGGWPKGKKSESVETQKKRTW